MLSQYEEKERELQQILDDKQDEYHKKSQYLIKLKQYVFSALFRFYFIQN